MGSENNMMTEEIIKNSDNEEVIGTADGGAQGGDNSESGSAAEEIGGADTSESGDKITPPKTFTQDEVNEMMKKRDARYKRREERIRKEAEGQNGELIDLLRAGTGEQDVTKITKQFKDHYTRQGMKVPEARPTYTDREAQILAKADAEDIIGDGMDAIIEEGNRLAKIGADKMTPREKALFKILYEERESAQMREEYSKIGIGEDVYSSQDFKDFSSKFVKGTTPAEIYNLYKASKGDAPKKNIKPVGSVANSRPESGGVKEYYTPEEAKKFTVKDFDSDPKLYEAVQKSMHRWKKH